MVFRHLFDLYAWAPGKDEAPKKITITIASDVGLREDRFTATHTRADDVAFTDDGLEIAFTAGGDLWVMDSELREPIQVTKTDGQEANPIFANDGKSIYFTRAIDGQIDLWQVKPTADDKFWWQQREFTETQITKSAESESDVQLSADGKKLFYQKGRGDLAVLNLETKESTLLVDGFNPLEYSLSPDGTWIAYATQDSDFNSEIWLMPVDRSRPPVNVSRHPDNDNNPLFSPDGKILAFTGRRVGDESDIYYVYLREEDDDKSSRDRKLEKALEAMKKRKGNDSKSSDNKPENKDAKKKEEADAGEAGQRVRMPRKMAKRKMRLASSR